MRIQILSDLHADVYDPGLLPLGEGVDVVVIAGDTCEGAEASFQTMRKLFPQPVPIVTVLGNHEFYRTCLPEERALANELAPQYGITLLDDTSWDISGVHFVGGTLWTDYELFGKGSASLSMNACQRGMNDHRRIKWVKEPWERFLPQHARLLHNHTKAFLADAVPILEGRTGPVVIVTHHAPHLLSIALRYETDTVTAAYASNLELLIKDVNPNLWVHGHVHHNNDYTVGGTRIVSNPHGYGYENTNFIPSLVLEV